MKAIAHISDLHFGTVVQEIAEGLLDSLADLRPDLVVVSGDLTQRATAGQYREARAFLDRIPFPQIVVPGNHDVPLYDVIRRFFMPLDRYKAYITPDLLPFHQDGEIAVLGISTARSFTFKNGRISIEQIQTIRDRFCAAPPEAFKVLVTHHPFVVPPGQEGEPAVGRAERLFLLAEGCNPDMALAGHFHMSYTAKTHSVYTTQKGSTLVIQAGTATSRRTRNGEHNAYNCITVDNGRVELTVHMWNGSRFTPYRVQQFERSAGLWG